MNFNFWAAQYINKAEQATALAANMSQQIWAWTHPSQQCHQSFLTKNGSRMMFSSFCTAVLCIFLTQWVKIIFNELKNYSYVTVRHCSTFLASISKVSSIERANFCNELQIKLTWADYAEPQTARTQAQVFQPLHNVYLLVFWSLKGSLTSRTPFWTTLISSRI